jgi:hypothetical protein
MTDIPLTPATVNLIGIVQNDSWSVNLVITNGTAPYNLTGATIVSKISTSAGSYPLTVTVTDAVNGKLTLSMTSSPLIPYGSTWALRINARTLMEGTATGMADVLL